MLFSELYKIMVDKFTFLGFRGAIAPIAPPKIRPCIIQSITVDGNRYYE